MQIIRLNNVEKTFGENQVLKGLSLEVNKGEIFGFLGHNGAGKTTTLRIILGLLDIEGGDVEVFGVNPFKVQEDVRKRCGVLSEDNGLYEALTVYDNLKFFAEAYNCFNKDFNSKIDNLLERFEMLDKKHSVIKDFSLGMKKKVAIIRTLFHEPEIVLLDEPTNGLDPVSVNTFIEIMREMVSKNQTTFILTTHNLDVVSKVCDKVMIVKNGKNVYSKNLKGIDSSDLIKTEILYLDGDVENISTAIKTVDKIMVYSVLEEENKIVLNTKNKEVVSKVIKALVESEVLVYNVVVDSFDLNQIYSRTDSEVV